MSKVSVDSLYVLSQLQWFHRSTFSILFVPKQSEFCSTILHHVSLSLPASDDADPLFGLLSMITLLSLVESTQLSLSFTLVLGVLTRVDS